MRGRYCARGDFGSRAMRALERELNHETHELHEKNFTFVYLVYFVVPVKSKKKKVAFPRRTWQINPVKRVKDSARKYSRPCAGSDWLWMKDE